MDKNDIQLLFAYDCWANERVLRTVAPLRNEQFTRDLGSSFGSIRDTLVHVLGGDWIWLAYWGNPPQDAAALAELRARRDAVIAANMFPDVGTLQRRWAEFELEQAAFVEQLTEEALAQLIPLRSTHVKLAHLMQHVVNRSTYHRGQVTVIIRQLGAEPVATDFHSFVVEASPKAAEGP